MLILFLIIINPANGPFRSKITSMEDKISAYKLLERNSNSKINEEITTQQENSLSVQPQFEERKNEKLEETSINKIKNRDNIKLIWNYDKICIIKN